MHPKCTRPGQEVHPTRSGALPKGSPTVRVTLLAAAAFLGVNGVLAASDYYYDDLPAWLVGSVFDAIRLGTYFGTPLLVGGIAGRWWVLLATPIILVPFIPLHAAFDAGVYASSREISPLGTAIFALVQFQIPLAAIGVIAGKAIRRVEDDGRDREDEESL